MRLKKTLTALLIAVSATMTTSCASLEQRLADFMTGDGFSLGDGGGDLERELNSLRIVTKVDNRDYKRSYFGPSWTDRNDADPGGTSRNGCDTRNDMLSRDLTNIQKEGNCKVVSGLLSPDPYTGRDIPFLYGRDTSSAIQIDHIVSLKDAWVSGADSFSTETRTNIANDPLNLIASDGPSNMRKQAQDASTWLVPDNPSFRCEYASRTVQVKYKYGLGVSENEYAALRTTLNNC